MRTILNSRDFIMPTLVIENMVEGDIPRAIAVFESAYAHIDVPPDEQEWFTSDLVTSFKTGSDTNNMVFFKIEQSGVIVSFAAIQPLPFARGIWALRWGTTEPAHQSKGLMSALVDHRLEYAEKHTNSVGSVHIMARRPGLYLKKGFTPLYERGPENRATYMMKVINSL